MRQLVVVVALFLMTVNPAVPKAEERSLHCQCVLATTSCNFKVFDEAAGKPRHEWYRDFTTNESKTYDNEFLAKACWRKRDVDGQGDGLCCARNKDESDASRYFKGALK